MYVFMWVFESAYVCVQLQSFRLIINSISKVKSERKSKAFERIAKNNEYRTNEWVLVCLLLLLLILFSLFSFFLPIINFSIINKLFSRLEFFSLHSLILPAIFIFPFIKTFIRLNLIFVWVWVCACQRICIGSIVMCQEDEEKERNSRNFLLSTVFPNVLVLSGFYSRQNFFAFFLPSTSRAESPLVSFVFHAIIRFTSHSLIFHQKLQILKSWM